MSLTIAQLPVRLTPLVGRESELDGIAVLLVLDNCEHLAEAAAAMVEFLLAACPALVVLATSREALGVEGELSWPVPPLSLPQVQSAPTAAGLAGSDAVRLFEQRARLVRPSFRVMDDNAVAVLSICHRLDGLPLAIELAAARMRILSSTQLAERLDDMFAVLVGGARSAPPRHQALRATLDWSHDLLDADERVTFRRLADKSLLRVEHGPGESRYFLLATIRDYAREKLAAAASESDQVRRGHLRYFTELVERGRGPDRTRRGGSQPCGARARPIGQRAAQPAQSV